MSWELKKGHEIPTGHTSVPPPADDLRHVDRLATFGLLAAGVVQELGSTLGVASMHAEAIARGEVDGEAARASARIVAQQLERMTERFRRLLGFAHEELPKRERVDVHAVARRVAELFVPLAAKRDVTVRMAPGDRIEVDADALQFEQVVANLVLNAIQVSPPGGAVAISVREAEDEGERVVCLEVADDGPGIAEEHRLRIFEPFFTTKSSGQGTGLGLSVAEAIVRDHGGWIDVESAPGKGSSFRVHLPSGADQP